MSAWCDQILTFIKRERLILPGQTILVAVSGGADSMALLQILLDLKANLGCHLVVAHINHGLRASAKRDAQAVKKSCQTHRIPYKSATLNLKSRLKNHASVEEVARDARYKKLVEFAKGFHADAIALGHHQDDLAETVLMRILRGSGLKGLQAILPKRQLFNFTMIRPLLNVSRQEIRQYLNEKHVPFHEDETNASDVYFRNKIRLRLMPLLKKAYQPQIVHVLNNLALTALDDFDYLHGQAQQLLPSLIKSQRPTRLQLNLKQLQSTHVSLVRMSIRLVLEKWIPEAKDLNLSHLLEIEELIHLRPTGSIVHLTKGLQVTKLLKSLDFTILKSLH